MRTYRRYKNYSTPAKMMAWGIDICGGFVYRLLNAFWRVLCSVFPDVPSGQPAMKSILLIRLDHLGDVLMTTPAIRALKQHFPDKSLHMLVSPSSYPVVEGHPDLDQIYTFSVPWFDGKRFQRFNLQAYLKLLHRLRSAQFEIAIDFRGDLRSVLFFAFLSGARQRVGFEDLGGEFLLTTRCEYDEDKHFVESNLDLLRSLGISVNSQESRYVLPSSPEDQGFIDNLLAEFRLEPQHVIVGIHPTTIAHWTLKRWKSERFAELADRLNEQSGVKIILTGGKQELEAIAHIAGLMKTPAYVAAGRTSVKQLGALIKRCQLFISNDSGPMHIAVAAQTPLVAIFGPTNPQRSGPYGNPELYRIVQHPVPCRRPCFVSACPRQHECMEAITVEQVLRACHSFLREISLESQACNPTNPGTLFRQFAHSGRF